uniref:Uncharacterized protein n=1 Tax=Anopheles melas TaxID=34690 RepID=A0A182TCU0_9DIPT
MDLLRIVVSSLLLLPLCTSVIVLVFESPSDVAVTVAVLPLLVTTVSFFGPTFRPPCSGTAVRLPPSFSVPSVVLPACDVLIALLPAFDWPIITRCTPPGSTSSSTFTSPDGVCTYCCPWLVMICGTPSSITSSSSMISSVAPTMTSEAGLIASGFIPSSPTIWPLSFLPRREMV